MEESDLDILNRYINEITAKTGMDARQIEKHIGYNKGYISQIRSRGTVPKKFMDSIKSNFSDLLFANKSNQRGLKSSPSVDIGTSVLKIEATVDVIFSLLCELIAERKGQVGTIFQKELEKAVKSRMDFLVNERSGT